MRAGALLLMIVAVVAAGCGSGAKSPGVASLGVGATTTSTSQSLGSSGAGLSTGRGGGNGLHVALRGNLKFSRCMRSHGVANFPDPNGQGQIGIDSASGIDPGSPTFQSAMQACRKNLPNGGQPNPQQLAKAKKAALAFSACMRAHGVKDFPDPDFSGGTVQLKIGSKQGSDLDPNNPTFKKAQAACGSHLDFAKP